MINLSTWQKEFDPFGPYDEEVAEEISRLFKDRNYFINQDTRKIRGEYKEFILSKLPNKYNEISYAVSGSEALEHAIIISRKITGKKKILVFNGCYNGSSMQLLPISYPEFDDTNNDSYLRIDPPYCYRCDYRKQCVGDSLPCIQRIEEIVQLCRDSLSGIFVDPSFGNILLSPPKVFFVALRNLCNNYGIQLIFDETRTAFGRKGCLFSFTTLPIYPDILVLNKSLACGIPLALTIYQKDRLDARDIIEMQIRETTFSGNMITLGISRIAIQHFQKCFNQDLYNQKVESILNGLTQLLKYPIIGDIRNFGMMFAIEVIGPRKEYDRLNSLSILRQLYVKHQIIIHPPNYKSIILLYPMLTITLDDISYIISSFDKVIAGHSEKRFKSLQNSRLCD
jgi:4-aminobutyrate aminotransferase/(S)-3-amino-2-methylpropionate transaminase